jgi:hypothetical protein
MGKDEALRFEPTHENILSARRLEHNSLLVIPGSGQCSKNSLEEYNK